MSEVKTYEVYIECSVCGYPQEHPVAIPKGVKWYTHLKDIELKCTNCECVEEKSVIVSGIFNRC